MDISCKKAKVRRILSQLRQDIIDKDNKEQAVSDKLLLHLLNKKVFIYVSFGSELSTHNIINKLFSMGNIVAVPKVVDGNMTAVQLIKYQSLVADNKTGNLLNALTGDNIKADVAVVPMLGFNANRYRLGYGGGYYDRYLSAFNGIKIGVAFDEQLFNNLPLQDFDVPLDMIITPTQIY